MSDGLMLLALLGTYVFIALCVVIIFMIIHWREYVGDDPKIKFSSFKKFYAVNPDRWTLNNCYVSCYRHDTVGSILTHFGFIDFYRYKLWRKQMAKRDLDKKRAKDMAVIIASVKRDIANTERIAKQKYEQAEDIMDQITALG